MTQGQTAQPAPPTAPAIAGANGPAAAMTSALTAEDIIALRARRSELSNQLNSAAGRRASLANELNRTADPAARAGLESRIAVLDKRMIQLESDIAQTGQVLSSDAASRIAVTEQANNFMGIDPNVGAPLLGAFMFLVLMPIAVGIGRMFWKRGNHPPATTLPPVVAQSAERLARLEQSVDAIAVEIERISEGQRFVTKLLSEKAPALPPQSEVNEQLKDTMQFQRP
jgi:hypothetical protein